MDIQIIDKIFGYFNITKKVLKDIIVLVLLLILATVVIVYPLEGLTVIFLALLLGLFMQFPIKKLLYWMWPIIVISALAGSYLGIPGHESIFLFRVVFIVQIFLMSVYYVTNQHSMVQIKEKNSLDVYLLLMAWIFVCFLSLFWSTNYGISIRYSYYAFEAASLVILPTLYIKNNHDLRLILRIITLFYLVSVVVGLSELFFGNHLPQSGSLVYETTTSKYQPTGFLYNTNDYAMFLVIFLPFVFSYLYTIKNLFIYKCLAVGIWLSSCYIIISTYSRLGIIAVSFVSLIIYYIYFRKKTLQLICFFFSYLLLSEMYSNSLFKNIVAIVESSFTKKGNSTDDRMNLYTTTWNLFIDHSFIGVGAGTVPIEIAKSRLGYRTTQLEFNSGHNFFLELLGSIGVFIVPLLIVFLILFFRFFQFYWRENKESMTSYIPLLVIFIFCIASVALSTIIEQRFLWLALGLALAITQIEKGG